MVRRSSADYLEESTREDLIADLEGRGYRVAREAMLGDQRVDLLAERDGERLAYEVKARSRLRDSARQIEQLREAAQRNGVSNFRVVVAVPPRTVDVTIEDFESELLDYFFDHDTPNTLNNLSSGTRVEDVTDIEIETVELTRSGTRVRGRGYVDLELNYGGGVEKDGVTAFDSLPFSFDVELDSDLHIVEMRGLTFDTSSFSPLQ
jgi:Holliday junction resolvase